MPEDATDDDRSPDGKFRCESRSGSRDQSIAVSPRQLPSMSICRSR